MKEKVTGIRHTSEADIAKGDNITQTTLDGGVEEVRKYHFIKWDDLG